MTPLQEREEGPQHKELLSRVWIRLEDCFRETERSTYRLLYETAPAYVLILAAKRHGNIVINGMLYPLTPHTVYIVMPGQRVETTYDSDGDQVLYRFHVETDTPEKYGAQQGRILPDLARVSVNADTLLLSFCEKIIFHWHTDDAADRFVSQAGFQELLHLLFKNQGQHEAALDQVCMYINDHFREGITVDHLSELAGMSRYYFMRSFKDRFGQSAMDYLTELRTNQAKSLLDEGQSLQKVAEEVGYRDRQYFSSQFKKHVGMSPSIYIANRTCKVAAYSWPNVGQLLSLQIIPYAAPIDQTWSDDYRKKYRFDIKVPLGHDYNFNREALWRARPDRIVALDEMVPDEEKKKLRQIAPVLFLPWHSLSWREHLKRTVEFLDRDKEAESWLGRYDKKAEVIRENIPYSFRQGGLLILNILPRGFEVWGKRAGTVLYDDLQIHCARGVEHIEFTEQVQAGQLASFDADILLVNVMKDGQSLMNWQRLQRSKLWQRLKAVRNGHVYQTSGQAWLAEPILEYTANRHYDFLQELEQLFRAL
ncbi:helix-turn-helix domain-containing protein [Paenibacillus sp. NPDC058177]|uniref:helix-turn-helix domain-containing protein n=1 Tax=Paenibacillus sp. NPDC058177 TaxID=3346369 RepID=UPI0036DAA38F